MRLILIRHGESIHNREHFIAGVKSCRGLTPAGRGQATALSKRLQATGELDGCQVLLTSPLRRAQETAAPLADHLPDLELRVDDRLAELRPGAADGLPWETYVAQFGSFDLTAQPERPFAPDGESWHTFTARVNSTLAALADEFSGQTVAAVTHGGFIVVSLLNLFAIPRPGTGARFEPHNTGLTEWHFEDGRWTLNRYNDVSHLHGIA